MDFVRSTRRVLSRGWLQAVTPRPSGPASPPTAVQHQPPSEASPLTAEVRAGLAC